MSWLAGLFGKSASSNNARDANPDYPDGNGWTPLMIAALRGDAQEARSLIARGASVNAKDRDGETPLYKAVQEAPSEGATRPGCVIVSPEEARSRGNPYYISAEQNSVWRTETESRYMAVIKLLLDNGADVNGADTRRTIINVAHSVRLQDFLRARGAR